MHFIFHAVMQSVLTYLRNPVIRKRASEATVLFGSSAVITSGFAHYMYSVRVCKGPSMLPTLPTNRELVVVDKFSYIFQDEPYKYGDVVVSISMRDPEISKTPFFAIPNFVSQ